MNTLVVFAGSSSARFPAPEWDYHVLRVPATAPHALVAQQGRLLAAGPPLG